MATQATPKAAAPKVGMVKALEKGYYDGVIRDAGAVFPNTLGLKTKGEGPDYDPTAWFVATDAQPPADSDDMA
jgi:hypothetical protein